MNKVLILLFVTCFMYFINMKLGLFASAVFMIVLVYKYLSSILAFIGSRAYGTKGLAEAIKWYKMASAVKNAPGKIKANYGLLLLRDAKPDEAVAQFDAVINNKSSKPEDVILSRQFRCMAYLKQDRLDEAMSEANLLFANVKNTLTYGIMGYFMQLTNAPISELLSVCEDAYEYNSDDRDIIDNLVAALIKSGQLRRARDLAASLRAKHPTFVEAYYHSALIEAKLGDKESAREFLDKISSCRRTYLTTISEAEIEALEKEVS